MENIKHKVVSVNGINMHVAEIGEGPAVLFLHGFPELWYTWRHQMLYLSSKGYRAIAPDLRGYGDSDAPPNATDYTAFHIVGDLVALLGTLGLDKVFLVGNNWGAVIAWYFCMFRPDLIKALVNLRVVFDPRNPATKPVEGFRKLFGDDYYLCRFQDPGVAEAGLAEIDTAELMIAFLTTRDPRPPCIPKDVGFGIFVKNLPPTLPPWLTMDDVNYFAAKFNKTGFSGGLNYYRALDLNWELLGAWSGAQIKVPVKFMVGELDLTYHIPGVQDYIHKGGFKKDVPGLQEVVIIQDAAHFVNQEKPDEINAHIFDFINKF